MKRTIHLIVVHCSATREGCALTPEALDRCHRRRGFKGTGYHYYIRRDGETVLTRPPEIPGAHVKGWNAHSIGICYEGGLDRDGCPADTRSAAQRTALRTLVCQLLKQHPDARVCGHRDLSPDLDGDGVVEPQEWVKQCPCFDVAAAL